MMPAKGARIFWNDCISSSRWTLAWLDITLASAAVTLPDVDETALEVAVGPDVDRGSLYRLDGARKRELRDWFAASREDHAHHRHPIFHGAGGGFEILVPAHPRQGAGAHQPDDPDQHDDGKPGDANAGAAQADRARICRPERWFTQHLDLLLRPPGTAAAAGAGCR